MEILRISSSLPMMLFGLGILRMHRIERASPCETWGPPATCRKAEPLGLAFASYRWIWRLPKIKCLTIMENQMDLKMENEMETWII